LNWSLYNMAVEKESRLARRAFSFSGAGSE
jgi:hypothetical protein